MFLVYALAIARGQFSYRKKNYFYIYDDMYLSLGTLTDLEVEIDELALRNTESNK